MRKIRPLNNRVLVKRAKAESTKGGIILPETVQEKPKEGHVVALGEGVRDEEGHLHPINLRVGDRVLFPSFAGSEVKNFDSDEEYLILSEEDVLGVFN